MPPSSERLLNGVVGYYKHPRGDRKERVARGTCFQGWFKGGCGCLPTRLEACLRSPLAAGGGTDKSFVRAQEEDA